MGRFNATNLFQFTYSIKKHGALFCWVQIPLNPPFAKGEAGFCYEEESVCYYLMSIRGQLTPLFRGCRKRVKRIVEWERVSFKLTNIIVIFAGFVGHVALCQTHIKFSRFSRLGKGVITTCPTFLEAVPTWSLELVRRLAPHPRHPCRGVSETCKHCFWVCIHKDGRWSVRVGKPVVIIILNHERKKWIRLDPPAP